MRKLALWAFALAFVLGAIVALLAFRPYPSPPADGRCPDCAVAITPIGYGMSIGTRNPNHTWSRIWLDCWEYDVERDAGGGVISVRGGCVLPPTCTGYVCMACRRTWCFDRKEAQISDDMPLLWRFQGGLMRLF